MAYLEDIPKYAFGTAFETESEQERGERLRKESEAVGERTDVSGPKLDEPASGDEGDKPDSSDPAQEAQSQQTPLQGQGRLTPAEVKELVTAAIDLGCRHFDCAPLYKTQKIVGEALSEAITRGAVTRKELFVASKLPPNMMRPENVQRSVTTSIDELRVDYLDLVLIHAPFSTVHVSDEEFYPTDDQGNLLLDEEEELLENAWRRLVELKKDGRTRYIGLCNVNLEQLARLNGIHQVDVVQNEYHIHNQDREMFDYCEEIDVHFEAYAAMGSPILSARKGKPSIAENPVVKRVSKEHQLSIAQVSVLWIRDQPLSFVIRCDNLDQLKENLTTASKKTPPLSSDELINLDTLNKNIRIHSFDEHKGIDKHREYPFHTSRVNSKGARIMYTTYGKLVIQYEVDENAPQKPPPIGLTTVSHTPIALYLATIRQNLDPGNYHCIQNNYNLKCCPQPQSESTNTDRTISDSTIKSGSGLSNTTTTSNASSSASNVDNLVSRQPIPGNSYSYQDVQKARDKGLRGPQRQQLTQGVGDSLPLSPSRSPSVAPKTLTTEATTSTTAASGLNSSTLTSGQASTTLADGLRTMTLSDREKTLEGEKDETHRNE